MKISLLLVGKTDNPVYNQLMADYEKRLVHYIPFSTSIIPDIKNAKNLSFSQQKVLEGERILNYLQPGDFTILLDEKGREYTSQEFALYLSKLTNNSYKRIVFIVGGAYGFSENVYEAANGKISLSKMTFSHQMARLFFIEQLYRAFTIINNEPYHHS
jgi:23S rRNA (pseudouridine1915-N3)-methyltransferase